MCLGDLHPLRLRQLRLPLIERPESFRFEFQRAGHVQGVQCSHTKFRSVAASQINAQFESIIGQRDRSP
jgi:hypothetical protein